LWRRRREDWTPFNQAVARSRPLDLSREPTLDVHLV
jgi:hypothetical protein